jgi:hypothetical protein
VAVDFTLSSLEAGEPALSPPYSSLWFKLTPSVSGNLQLWLNHAFNEDVAVSVYSASAGTLAGLVPVTTNLVNAMFGDVVFEFSVASGVEYALQIAERLRQSDTLTWRVTGL